MNARDLSLRLNAETSASEVVEKPISLLDIETEARSFDLALDYPLRVSLTQSASTSVRYRRSSSDTFLLGEPFTFSLGADQGHTEIDTLDWALNWTVRAERSALAMNSRLTYGLKASQGGRWNRLAPKAHFLAALVQGQYVRRMGTSGLELSARLDLQWSDDPLFSAQRFALGGSGSVRGYRKNALLADKGLMTSLTLNYPLAALDLRLRVFADYGYGRNVGQALIDNEMASLGLGVDWRINKAWDLSVSFARKMINRQNKGDDPQDRGLHIALQAQF